MDLTCLDSLGLSELELDELVEKAQLILGEYVLNTPLETDPTYQCYVKAVCYQAKYLHTHECDIIRPSGVNSMSVRNLSISYNSNTLGADLVSPYAYKVLQQCGLITSVIGTSCNGCGCL